MRGGSRRRRTRSGAPRDDVLPAAAFGIALFAAYAVGACPTIHLGESAAVATAVGGMADASGHPLYVALGRLWTLALPFGSLPWRLSVLSAACAATACALVFRLCRASGARPLAALVAALLLAFAPSFWGAATVPRPSAFGTLLLVVTTHAAVRWRVRPARLGRLALAFFLCGLGAGDAPFLLAYAIVLGLFAFAVERAIRQRLRRLLLAAAALLPGLLFVRYPSWRTLPVPVFGALDRSAWIETPADLPVIALAYLRGLGGELAWAGLGLALIGVLAGGRRRRVVVLPLLVMVANLTLVAAGGSHTELFITRHSYLPSTVMAAWLAGLGCHAVLGALPRSLRLVPLALPAFLFVTGWREFDHSQDEIAERYGRAVLQSVSPGAHLIAADATVRPVLFYLQRVEGVRPDVRIQAERRGDATPLFFTHHPDPEAADPAIAPIGIVLRAGDAVPPVIPFTALPGENDPWVPKDYLTQDLIGHFHSLLALTFEGRDWLRARRELAAAAAAAPNSAARLYDLGVVFRRNGLFDDARASFARSAAIDPRYAPEPARPRATARVAAIDVERARVEAIERTLVNDRELRAVGADPVARHQRLAELLEQRGEAIAARGHRVRALEGAAGLP